MKEKNLKHEVAKKNINSSEKRFSVLEKDVSILKKDVSVLKQDVAQIKKDYVTTYYLDAIIGQMHSAFVQDMRQMENRIMITLDGIVKNIEDLRSENATHTFSYQRLEETSENHEVRISRLEKNNQKSLTH